MVVRERVYIVHEGSKGIYSGGLPYNGGKAKIRIFHILGKNQNLSYFRKIKKLVIL